MTADHHFGHENILQDNSWGYRPFDTLLNMHERLIEDWNAVVDPGDLVYHLGDLIMYNTEISQELHARLNGQIYFVKGNHDRPDDWAEDLTDAFVWQRTREEVRVDEYRPGGHHLYITIDHFPLRTWNRRFYGALHAHGHVHGKLLDVNTPGACDVGVDVAYEKTDDWRPFHVDEVVDMCGGEEYWNYLDSIKDHDDAEQTLSS